MRRFGHICNVSLNLRVEYRDARYVLSNFLVFEICQNKIHQKEKLFLMDQKANRRVALPAVTK